MQKQFTTFAIAAGLCGIYSGANAQTTTTTYDVNNSSLFTSTSNGVSPVTYNYDYSAQGIPQAPGTTNTSAMRLEANAGATAATAAGGVTVTPTAASLSGDYTISALVWLNTFGPYTGTTTNGSGTTEAFGVGGSYNAAGGVNYRGGTTAAPVGGGSGVWFATTVDGGFTGASAVLRDYSAFTGSGANSANFQKAETNAGVYAAGNDGSSAGGSQDNNNAFYTAKFPLIDVTQINNGALASSQNALAGNPATPPQSAAAGTASGSAGIPGITSFAWRTWTVQRVGTTVTWSIDGTVIATVNEGTAATGGAALTFFDYNAGQAAFPALDEAFVANLSITTTPEPASLSLFGLVGLAGVARRRRRV